jgi:hypothetical protein
VLTASHTSTFGSIYSAKPPGSSAMATEQVSGLSLITDPELAEGQDMLGKVQSPNGKVI